MSHDLITNVMKTLKRISERLIGKQNYWDRSKKRIYLIHLSITKDWISLKQFLQTSDSKIELWR